MAKPSELIERLILIVTAADTHDSPVDLYEEVCSKINVCSLGKKGEGWGCGDCPFGEAGDIKENLTPIIDKLKVLEMIDD